jgi:AraC-like DNA-binding protein
VRIAVNPASDELGTANAIVGGTATQYEVRRFAGPLSLKSVIRGEAEWVTEHGTYRIAPGTMLLLREDEEYSLRIDALRPVETFCVFFQRGFIERPSPATRLTWSPAVRAALALLKRDRSEESMDRLAMAIADDESRVTGRVESLRAVRAATRDEIGRRLEVARSYLHGNLASDISLDDVARHCAMSRFHFHRHYTAMFGRTPHRYLTELRIEAAKQMLQSSDSPVIEVAQASGFTSLAAFTALFRRESGLPPARFRKNQETPRLDRR